jgi:hypothetical protein
MLRDTLAWAREVGLEFIVDRKFRKDGGQAGYFAPGSGAVAIAAWCFTCDDGLIEAIATAVHETRHAWQEVQKLSPNICTSLTDYAQRRAVVEADATAHEKLAVRQYREARAGQASAETDVRQEMWDYFKAWYPTQGAQYAALAENDCAEQFGLAAANQEAGQDQPSYNDFPFEFWPQPSEDLAFRGVDITRPEQFRRLAKTYGGANYFDAAESDFLQREVLSPGRAAAHFSAGPPTKLAQQIRRAELRQKFAGRKMRCPKM